MDYIGAALQISTRDSPFRSGSRPAAQSSGSGSALPGPAGDVPIAQCHALCVSMTWAAMARARHQLESSLSKSRDSYGDGVSPVVDGSGPMRKCCWISLNLNRCY